MTAPGRRAAAGLAALALGAGCAASAWAQEPPREKGFFEGADINFSPYTYHFHPSDEHKPVVALGFVKPLEEDNWNYGASIFSNSFGQPSAYVFIGQRYVDPFGWDRWYLQWNVGILYGYVGEYKDKVPFNFKGFSPGFVPSVGYKFSDRVYGELDLLGNSALMFTLIFPIPKGGF